MQENEIVDKLQLVFPGQLIAYKGEMIHCNMDDKVPYFETNALSSLYKHLKKIDYGAFLTSNPYKPYIHTCMFVPFKSNNYLFVE